MRVPAHLVVFVALYAPTVVLTTVSLLHMKESDRRDVPWPGAPFVYALGPFAGAALRGWSNSRVDQFGPFLAVPVVVLLAAAATQAVRPATRAGRATQLVIWGAGLLAWFAAAAGSLLLAFG